VAAREEIVAHASALLEVERFPEFGPPGLQVVGASEVTTIACGVSCSRELFERAVAVGAELVLVHHGLFWRNEPLVVDARLRGRLETLFRGNASLVAYHLALDAHPTLGNNAQLAERIGATPEGKKELVGFHVGRRESAQSWRELLVDLKARGLAVAPELAVGDGALGFRKALDEVFPGTRHQRCWVHKVSNVLGKFPKSMGPTGKSDLRDIWQAETRAAAEAAIDTFAEKYRTKYDKAVACLTKDREALLAFFDFPAEHWDHLRTANPIESVFATVRHRTVRTKGALSQKTAKLMVFTLVRAASKTWRRLTGANQLPLVVDGIKFTDGVAPSDAETRAA